jgi:catalase
VNPTTAIAPAGNEQAAELSRNVIRAFENLSGSHPGFRPAHAKGILLGGVFVPSAAGSFLTRAPHLHRASTPVSVRLSDFAGVPKIPDGDPDSSPRGMAIRFHLAEHVHTDITAHSVNAFPARTAEGFVEFLQAVHGGGPSIQAFLATHPAALAFEQAPKPTPSSFAGESFFAVCAYKFIDADGVSQYGRYRVVPEIESHYLDAAEAAAQPSDFLFDEIRERLASAPVKFRIIVQLAQDGDVVDDSTIQWPAERPVLEFGTLELTRVIPNNDDEQRHIIFDPIPRVDGIESSGDPLLEARAAAYLMSGRRRRKMAQGDL